jgi:hypothetical protein
MTIGINMILKINMKTETSMRGVKLLHRIAIKISMGIVETKILTIEIPILMIETINMEGKTEMNKVLIEISKTVGTNLIKEINMTIETTKTPEINTTLEPNPTLETSTTPETNTTLIPTLEASPTP